MRIHTYRVLKRLSALLLLLALASPGLPAEDDVAGIIKSWDTKITLESRLLAQRTDWGENPGIRMPDYLKDEKTGSDLAKRYSVLKKDELTDNPLKHGAMYIDLGLEAGKGGVRLGFDIIMEHRGMSYGVYNMDNIVIFPKFHAALDTALQVRGETIEIGASAGNHDDFSIYEGLTIYNIDAQGVYAYLKWRNFRLWHSHIGDLSNGVGLDIEDAMDYALSIEDFDLSDKLLLNIQAGYYYYPMRPKPADDALKRGVNVSIALTRKESLRIYSQLAIREVEDPAYSGIKRCGHLAGCKYRYKNDKLDISLVAERRFYGRYFNWGYKNTGGGFRYRPNNAGSNLYGSTVGDYLYPLSLYFRPFGQWAVYTEYQGRDVQSLIFRAEVRYGLPAGFFIDSYLDFNHIEVSNEPSFLYPFYDIGIGWEPVKGVYTRFGWTNRGMNLDRHYPTLYLIEPGVPTLEVGGMIEY